MTKKKDETTVKKMVKIVYFDEDAARDYIDIANEGHLDWNEAKNKEKLAKLTAEIDTQIGSGFNFLSFIKASLQGGINAEYNKETKRIIASQLSSTLLTEYIKIASVDQNIEKFNGIIFPPENSISKYKMYSPYTIIFPKDEIPIDLERLNEALDSARGYYEMLHTDNNGTISVLRFNDTAFRNNYNLSDLTKMKLKFFAVKVGACQMDNLDMSKEFEFNNAKEPPSAEEVLGMALKTSKSEICVFDVVIAGVENE